MKRLLYQLAPMWAIQALRRRREAKRRYKLALFERCQFHAVLDP